MLKNSKFLILAILVCMGFFALEASAQRRKPAKKRTVRSTQRTRQTPPPLIGAEVISLGADEFGNENSGSKITTTPTNSANSNVNSNAAPQANSRQTQTQADKEDAGLRDLDRLTQAEERAEALRRQLSDSMDKEAALKSRIEELDYQMRPENIQLETAAIGSLRPEEVRESRRRKLENEKTRVAEQINRMQENRVRLETAIASFDDLIGKLRAKVEASTVTPTGANAPANAPANTTNNTVQSRPDNPPQ